VLAPGKGRTCTGWLWVYVRDHRGSGSAEPPAVWFAVWFAYTPVRPASAPAEATGSGIVPAMEDRGDDQLRVDSNLSTV